MSDNQKQQVIDDGSAGGYFITIPHLVDDMGLSPQAYRLYGHLKRVAGESGKCWQSTTTLAEHCNMSAGAISAAKKELVEYHLIRIGSRRTNTGAANHVITLIDIWYQNTIHCGALTKQAIEPAPEPIRVEDQPLATAADPLRPEPKRQRKSTADPRTSHPAIVALRTVTGHLPPKGAYDLIISRLGENPDQSKLSTVFAAWTARGYKPTNLSGVMDWYTGGIPASPSRKSFTQSTPPPPPELSKDQKALLYQDLYGGQP